MNFAWCGHTYLLQHLRCRAINDCRLNPMPDFTLLPLAQLIDFCPPLRQVTSAVARSAWHELQRRALIEQNPTAWDALLVRLWPSMLFWIYTQAPEMAPVRAEIIAQRAIGEFQRQHSRPLDHASLVAALQRAVLLALSDHSHNSCHNSCHDPCNQ